MDCTSDNAGSPVRRTVYFSGCVQGVGFRFTTESIAAGFSVTGFVRNLNDGRVELVAEGNESELDRFQDAVHQALQANIREESAANTTPTGEFTSFRITS